MKASKVGLAILLGLCAVVAAYLAYVKWLAKGIFYVGFKLFSSETGQKMNFSSHSEPSSLSVILEPGTYVGFDTAATVEQALSDLNSDYMRAPQLGDLGKSVYSAKMTLIYATLSANMKGNIMRDFRFGTVYKVTERCTIQDISDNVGSVTWLKTLLDEIDRGGANGTSSGALSKAVYLLNP